ncbi:MAG: hypothetical protein JKY91_03535, partial [Emcibacter sp.]|nr:hypothetical protein [Emcibacter sp.]
MTSNNNSDSHFFQESELDSLRTQRIVDTALHGMDDGELYLQYAQSESFSFDDGRLKSAAYDTTKGFGLRAVQGEVSGYAHSSELSEDALLRAKETVQSISSGKHATLAIPPRGTNEKLYSEENPLLGMAFRDKIALLEEIDAFARARDPKICQVSCSITGEWQTIEIIRPGGHRVRDI